MVSGDLMVRCSPTKQPQRELARKCREPTRNQAGRETADEQREQADCNAGRARRGGPTRAETSSLQVERQAGMQVSVLARFQDWRYRH